MIIILHTFAILISFLLAGETLVYALSLPIPGRVIGMLLLLLYLSKKKGAIERLAPTSLELLRNMSLLFVPSALGIITMYATILREWLPILLAVVASTLVSIVVTAVVTRALQKK